MQFNLSHAFLAALLLGGVSRAEDAKLRELEALLASAPTQTDMNIASRDIAKYLDEKLNAKEVEIAKDLDPTGYRVFSDATKLWHDYRLSQSLFEADRYRGGTIQPLIHNRAYIRITQERLSALSRIMEPRKDEK